jgi:hypothetical protein
MIITTAGKKDGEGGEEIKKKKEKRKEKNEKRKNKTGRSKDPGGLAQRHFPASRPHRPRRQSE